MKANKTRFIKNLLIAVLVLSAGWFIRQQNVGAHHVGWTVAMWALGALVVVRIGLALRRGHKLVREHASSGVSLKSVDQITTASMPESMRGAYGLEKRMYAAAWRALTGKPLLRIAEFSVDGGPRSARMLTLASLALVAISGGAVLAGVQLGLGLRGLLILGGATLFIALYLGAWLIGSRRILHESGHDISLDFLSLDVGLRASAVLPMAAVLRAHSADILGVLEPDDVWTLAPFDAPNVLVELDGLVDIDAKRFGYPTHMRKRFIALYVDEPSRFIAAVAHALPGSLRATG